MHGYRGRDGGRGRRRSPTGTSGTGSFRYDDGVAGGAALLDLPEPPTAIFAGSDEIALGRHRGGPGARAAGPGGPQRRRLRRHPGRPVRLAAADHRPPAAARDGRRRAAHGAAAGGRREGRLAPRRARHRAGRPALHRTAGPALSAPGRSTRRKDPNEDRRRHAGDRRGAPVPGGVRLGRGHRQLPDRGRRPRGRPGTVHLGHVLAPPRRGGRRRHRRRRRRPLPPLPRGRRADGRPRRHPLPLLAGLAAAAADRAGPAQPGRAGLLPAAGRRAARPGHPALGHALPLGPAAAAGGRRRLAGPGHRRAVRRLRRGRARPAEGPDPDLDHAERAVVLGLPRVRRRPPCARADRAGRRPGRRPPPAARARAGRPGDAGAGPGQLAGHHAQPSAGRPGHRVGRGRRRGPAGRRGDQPGLPRPDLPRRVPGGPAGGRRRGVAISGSSGTGTSGPSPRRSTCSG